jgi:hypothetical protein
MGDMADYYRVQQMGDEFLENFPPKVLKPLLHKCKDGKIVDIRGVSKDYPKMDDNHLINTIKYIQKRAKEGIRIREDGGSDADSFWYEEDFLIGKKALKHLHYKKYVKEAIRRNLRIP